MGNRIGGLIYIKYELDKLNLNDVNVSFLHLKDGRNVFKTNEVARMLGVDVRKVDYHLTNIMEQLEANSENLTIRLKSPETNRVARYYDFTVINMIASRINTDKAMSICLLAGRLLNEKFNKEIGFKKDKLTLINETITEKETIIDKCITLLPEVSFSDKITNDALYEKYKAEAELSRLREAKENIIEARKTERREYKSVKKFLPQNNKTIQGRLIK